MGVPTLTLLLVLSIVRSGVTVTSDAEGCGYTIVLLGSTGDLAKRYIWPALFDNSLQLYTLNLQDCQEQRLVIFGASRSEVADRETALDKSLVNVKCKQSDSQCLKLLANFKESINFVKVKTSLDFEQLSQIIRDRYEVLNIMELGRLVYLSIPPSAYVATVDHISEHLKPSGLTWLRVILEKPFGHNLSSALALNEAISEQLEEMQVYRIDHYLGKFGVQLISNFLAVNSDVLKPLWNSNEVQLMEVAMEETLDVSGRGSFYNANGVIRDIHQNHLTEILTILLMNPILDHQTEKFKVLSDLFSPRLHHTVLGQYTDYQKHLQEDRLHNHSNTPTYASVALYSRNPKWSGVPFVLTSGKQLSRRRAFARVIFKQGVVTGWTGRLGCPPEIHFLIQQDGSKPGILISEHFSSLDLKMSTTSIDWIKTLYNDPESNCLFTHFEPKADIRSNSYISLIGAVLNGEKEYFVDSECLLESWRIWTPLLEEIDLTQPHPLLYSADNLPTLEELSFHGIKRTPPHTQKLENPFQDHVTLFCANSTFTESEQIKHKIVLANKYELSSILAEDLLSVAVVSIDTHGSFHLALPGGTSPVLLLGSLSLDYQHSFPWGRTHIWQTDERCVYPTNQHSNFRQLTDHLFSTVPIPYLNLHPMPVHLQQGLCIHGDYGADFYQKQLIDFLPEGQLDYVLLGVGSDGHIASIFPFYQNVPKGDKFVEVVEWNGIFVNRRMTLTLNCILEARHIGLVFIGENKRDIVQTVKRSFDSSLDNGGEQLPVLKLIQRAKKEQLTLYIDQSCCQ